MKKNIGIILAAVLLPGFVQIAQADLFGTGENAFTMDFVDITGDNSPDTTGYGAVSYGYRIATYEVTIDQFAKVRAMDSLVGNGNENYWGASVGTNAPAVNISWFGAAGFCNWLTSSNSLLGAYQFDGSGNVTNIDRATAILTYGRVFVLPTEDEWYKAAYYTGSGYSLYANGTNTAPGALEARYGDTQPWAVGGGAVEQNLTFDMMGNVWEWCETAYGETNHVIRGGAYAFDESYLVSTNRLWDGSSYQDTNVGFRVAAVPEPATALLLSVGGVGVWMLRRNSRKSKEEQQG